MKKLAISLLLLAGVSTAFAGGDPVAGKTKAASCIGCHGVDGNSANPDWPSLAGQGAPYIAKQIADFKSGARKDPTMTAMAAGLPDADVADVAAFFASQKRNILGADKAMIEMGKQIYRAGIKDKNVAACASCHGPTGIGNPAAKFPALSGQHAKYTTKALKDFRSGARGNDPQKMMQTVAARLSDKEIDAVASYVAGLH
ncbi:MAG: c-type cytochrome [Granulosicoccaceae bacterium]|jgi:cytochrome c553